MSKREQGIIGMRNVQRTAQASRPFREGEGERRENLVGQQGGDKIAIGHATGATMYDSAEPWPCPKKYKETTGGRRRRRTEEPWSRL